jgi:hypothetical protein
MTKVVVAGALASKPHKGGEAWVRLSYLLGFRKLGLETRFVEQVEQPSEEAVAYFEDATTRFGIEGTLVDRRGRPIAGEDVGGEDLLVNVSGNLRAPSLLRSFGRTAFVDIDPGFTQFWHVLGLDLIPEHDVYLTIGANIGAAGCPIPTGGITWHATRPPVVLDEWPVADGGFDRFTTVASWRAPFGAIEPYGLKHHEWRKVLNLPELSGLPFEAALEIHAADAADRDALRLHGWHLVDPDVAGDAVSFRNYVRASGAEFSVAQGIYVQTSSGWFSDRSARYLASGKPVLAQDTGFDRYLPVGEGLLSFRSLGEAVVGVRQIASDYDVHCAAARAIAEEYFDSEQVLGSLLEAVL